MSDILELLKAAAPNVERIETDFGTFYMQSITGEMHFHLVQVQQSLKDRGEKSIPPALVVAVALCSEQGEPLTEDLAETIKIVQRMHKDKLYILFDHALRVTGMGARALEDAEKKSSSSQRSETGTTSPS